MYIQSLNGEWILTETGKTDAIPATIPGCVHTDLLAAGRIPDPFYRDNEKEQFWVGETDWTYTRTFQVSDELLAYEQVALRCYGLDTIADVTLNGEQIAHTENMHRTFVIDIKPHLKAGENTLQIDFAAPMPYVRQMDAERGEMAAWVEPMRVNSAAWIRKEPCNFGWDWGPMLTTSGIWRDIEVIAWNTARLEQVQVGQEHTDDAVTLTVTATLSEAAPLTANFNVSLDGETVVTADEVAFDGTTATATLKIEDPQLWWINGLGEQPLYTVMVTTSNDQTESLRVGLRTLQLVTEPDAWGRSMVFTCNGIPFFAKGANWIPTTPYPGEAKRADYELFVGTAADANMNMLRVWGGGVYEDDSFYDVCDELGIAIWQDFMFACGTYPSFNELFMANVRAEAVDNVRRLRHHASIALWCGNNELEQGMPDPSWKESMSWEDYERLFDQLLPEVVSEEDPDASYWPGSPHSPEGDREFWQNQTCGDTHLWEVWHGKQPFEWYRDRQDRFCSEFGFQSFPEPSVMAEITEPEDHNITSYVMEYHQRSQIGNGTIIHYMLDWFRLPNSYEDMIWLSQILQGLAMKYAVEHWRRNMPRTMGTLYWQLNDMWPAPSWASVDWKGNWKALNYMAKAFYAQHLVSAVVDAEAGTAKVYYTADTHSAKEAKVTWELTTVTGENVASESLSFTPVSNGSEEIAAIDVSEAVEQYGERDLLLWTSLVVDGQLVSENLELFSRPKHMSLKMPKIDVELSEVSDGVYEAVLTTDVPALYTWLELPGASFSDNFFHLNPSLPKSIQIKTDDIDGLVVRSLTDTYTPAVAKV